MSIYTQQNNTVPPDKEKITVIQPLSSWNVINFEELKEYRDLFFFLVWRDIKILYAQTVLGFLWAILQPLAQILIFTVIFGNLAKIETDGIPYFLFSTVAIIPWTFISQAISQSSQSLVTGQGMLGKVYFPRLIFPLTSVFSRLVDFIISILIVILAMIYYQVPPTWNLLFFPVFTLMMISVSAGIGMWLSAMAIRFRDVKHAMNFLIKMLMYSAPIVYSASKIPENWRIVYSINPIVGTIEGFRACLLGTPIPWQYIYPGAITTLVILLTGLFYFNHMEKIFVDVI